MSEPAFTQEQVKHLIDVEGIKAKMGYIEKTVTELLSSFKSHAAKTEKDMDGLYEEIRKGEKELIECRNELKEEVYSNFVQKKEMRVWLAIAIFTVSATTGIIQWVVSTSDIKNTQIAEQVAQILKDHDKEHE